MSFYGYIIPLADFVVNAKKPIKLKVYLVRDRIFAAIKNDCCQSLKREIITIILTDLCW